VFGTTPNNAAKHETKVVAGVSLVVSAMFVLPK
jgi:hypothetical protein